MMQLMHPPSVHLGFIKCSVPVSSFVDIPAQLLQVGRKTNLARRIEILDVSIMDRMRMPRSKDFTRL